VLHVVYGEQVPKVMVLDDAESWALRLARPMRLFERLASPFVTVLDALAGLSLRVLGLQAEHAGHRSLYTVEELKDLVSESTKRGVLEPAEREMLHAVFDLGDLRARQVMVPRTEMVSVSADTPLDALVRQAVDTGLSKFPVFDGGADSIAGLVHVKDLLRALAEGRRDARARDLMRDVLFLPESVPVDALLRTMRAEQRRTVVLLDEYGGIAGLVTLEDLLEEIVGDVGDMFGRTEPSIVRLPDGSSRVSGLTQIEVVNEAFGLRLRDPHYDTIAGFVLGRLGRLAEVGDEIETDGLRLRVDALDGRRIAYVRVIPAGEAVEAGSAGNGSQPA
jgi:CBS domain containing-hemolysin-like protein